MQSRPELAAEPVAAGTLWRHRNFLLLWSGQTVSEMGSAVTQLALPLTAVVVLGASTFQVGLLTSAATAAFALSQSFAQVAGPGLGGGLVGLVGAAGAMAADAISYAVSVVSLLAIRMREEAPPADDSRAGLRAEIAEGLSFVLRHPILRKIVACTGTANLFGSMAVALEIVFLVRVLRVRPAETGLLIAAASLGGVAGGVLSGRLARRIGSARIIWYSLLVLGFPELLVPLAEPGWRVTAFVVGAAFGYFGAVVYNVAQVSYRQAICPPRLLGRMNAAVRWVVWGTIPLGALLGGVLGTLIGVRATLWIAFVGSWAAGWWVFFSPLRGMRETRR